MDDQGQARPDEAAAIRRAHERNVEAMTRATQLAVEGWRTIIRRQAEMVRAGIEEGNALVRDLGQARTPEERLAIHARAAKTAFDQGLAGGRELAEIASRSGNDALDVLGRRFREGIDEAIELAKPGE
jgi:phasin family protein